MKFVSIFSLSMCTVHGSYLGPWTIIREPEVDDDKNPNTVGACLYKKPIFIFRMNYKLTGTVNLYNILDRVSTSYLHIILK